MGTNAKEVADLLRKLADAIEQERVEGWNVEVSATPTGEGRALGLVKQTG